MFYMNKRKIFLLFLCLIFVLIPIIQPTFADEESEGKRLNPLILISSNPIDGAKDVPVQTEIILNFSKNIAHMTVRDKNIKCFSLVNAKGESVQTDIIIADNQIEPEKRRDVYLRPLHDLEPGITYTVIVDPSFQSKSEVKLGEELKINFTTVENKTSADSSEDKNKDTDNAETGQKASDTQQMPSDKAVNNPDSQNKDNASDQSAVSSTGIEKEAPIQDDVSDNDAIKPAVSTAENNELKNDTIEEQEVEDIKNNRSLGKISLIVLLSILIGFILYRLIKTRIG